VPADGWYEWVKDESDTKRKQPYYIKLKSDEPMFFAAIGQFSPEADQQPSDQDGFAIVTSASDKGMVDIHDRMPVVLPLDVASEWLGQDMAAERAEDLARHHAVQVESFEWHEVGKEVGKVTSKGPGLIKHIKSS
jgi:putative SOS response-associated peptidase YedK